MRLSTARTLAALIAVLPSFAGTTRHRTIEIISYNGLNLVMPATIDIFRSETADMTVHGQFVNLATAVEVRTESGATTSSVKVTVIGRSGTDTSRVVSDGSSTLSLRLTSTSLSTLGNYKVLIHYLVETNGPDTFPVTLYERGTVTSLAFTSPAPRSDPAGPAFLVGDNLTLHLQGTGMSRAKLAPLPRGMTVVQTVSRSSTDATFIVRFDSSGLVSVPYSELVFDGPGSEPPFNCAIACYTGSGRLIIMMRILPVASGVSPSTVPIGGTVVVTGARLQPSGYTPQILFLPKYRTKVGPNSISPAVTPLSTGGLSLAGPAGVRPDSIELRYLIGSTALHRDSLAAAVVAMPRILVTGSPPVVQRIDSSGVAGSRRAVLRVGSQILNGENLTTDELNTTTFTSFTTSKTALLSPILPTLQFGGTALTVQSAGYRSSSTAVPVAGQIGADSVVFTVPTGSASFADTLTRSLVLATPAGSFGARNVTFVPPPTLTDVRTFSTTTDVDVSVGLNATLVRGKQYRLRGRGLVVGSTAFNADIVRVRLNGVVVGVTLASNLESVITIPSTATSGSLTLFAPGGTATVGNFTVTDPPTAVTIVGMSLSPTTVVGGHTSTATVAFNGTVSSDGSAGKLAVTLASPDPAVVVPATLVPITSSPMTVSLPTRGVATPRVDTIRVSNDPNATGFGLVSALLTLLPPAPVSVTINPAAVAGGTTARGVVRLNSNVNGTTGLTVSLVNSDPTTATIPSAATIVGDSAVFNISTQVPPTDRPVTVTATSGGTSQSSTFTVTTATLATAAAQPASIMAGSGQATVTVTLTGSVAAPATATIACDAALTCPTSAAFTVGQTSASFAVSARPVLAAVADTVRITLNGVTKRATVAITPLAIQTLTLSPASVQAGVNSSLTIQLNAPVPAGLSATVALSSSDASVRPSSTSVSFAGGDQTKLVTLTTAAGLTATKTVTVTATFNENTSSGVVTSSKTAAITVTP